MSRFGQIWQRAGQMFALLACVSMVWLFGIGFLPAQAATTEMMQQDQDTPAVRLAAVIDCLPKQLSEPDLGRALKEMGNDYLERAFQLTDDPDVSKAEAEFAQCLKNKGYDLRANQNVK